MLAPLVAVENSQAPSPFLDQYKDKKQLRDLTIMVVSFSFWIFCAVYASHHCSIAHSTAIANAHFMFVSVFRMIQRAPVSKAEIGATATSILAVVLLFVTSDSNSTSDTYLDLNNQPASERFWNGKIVALFGSLSSAVYFFVSRQIRSSNTPAFLTLNISLFGIVVFFCLELVFEGYMHGNENDTIFAIFLPKVFLAMAGVAAVSGLVPNFLAGRLSKIFTPTAMSLSTFLQPPLAVVIAWIVGLQYLPHWPVWLALGLLLASQATIRDEVAQSASAAVAMDDRSADSRDQLVPFAHAPVLV